MQTVFTGAATMGANIRSDTAMLLSVQIFIFWGMRGAVVLSDGDVTLALFLGAS